MNFFSDFSDFHDLDTLSPPPREYIRRPVVTPLEDYTDNAFRIRYRMNKASFAQLVELLKPHLEPTSRRGNPYATADQLLIALRYYASGSAQLVSGDTHGIPQTTVSAVVRRVSEAICKLKPLLMKFPTNTTAAKTIADFEQMIIKRFKGRKRPFPYVIGAIDGTQIKTLAKGIHNRELLRNRKSKIAINVQAVADANMVFTDVVVRWYGSVHDSRIWKNSKLFQHIATHKVDGLLLGDSGYPLRTYLMTPLNNATTKAERDYNDVHAQARNVVERSFGLLKKRFPILGDDSCTKQSLKNALVTIMACFLLHNFLRLNRDDTSFGNEHDFPEVPPPPPRTAAAGGDCAMADNGDKSIDDDAAAGFARRQQIIDSHFS